MSPHRHGEDLRDRPIGELMGELARETSTLVRQERSAWAAGRTRPP